ncbi:transposase [Acinetobacter sp. Ac_3412]|uniref:Mu transposase C-terminal domain-containing protein n=1 Tax=Acinetobacter sp. Ac_3412 TaxID=1848935 RepID=UPI00148FB13B|nr:transposase [Acinetobacter sp. Ac_3412]
MNNIENLNCSVGFSIERSHIRINKGSIYLNTIDNVEYQLIEVIDINQCLFRNLQTNENKLMSINEFRNVIKHDGANISIDSNLICDEDWEKAQFKYEAIQPLISLSGDYIGTKGLEKRANECNVSTRTIRNWMAAFETTGSIVSLLEQKRGWSTGKVRLERDSDQLIRDVIKDYFLTKQRPSVEATIREVYRRCNKLKMKEPSKNAIRLRISQIPEKEYLKGRGFREKARNKFTAKPGHFPDADHPLSVVQIDHTLADVILVDDKYRKPIGRPWVTLAIDVYSRMITGFYVSLDAPSVTSVAMCLSRSILTKDKLLHDLGITDIEWPVYGYPHKIHVDNGPDFQSLNLKKSCALHGINIEFRPLARPEFGGHIERLIGSFMKKIHEIPGTTFSNLSQRIEYDSEKNAIFTFDEFEKYIALHISKVYHLTNHSSLEIAPIQKWRIGIFGDSMNEGIGIPTIPADEQTLILDFMPYWKRTVQHTGVCIDKLDYYDTCLNPFINTKDDNGKAKKYVFRRDPRDISKIWFYDPIIKKYFKVPFANQVLPQMSVWEFKQLSKIVLEKHNTINQQLIYQAWDEMQSLVSNAEANTQRIRRQQQRKKIHKKSQDIYESQAIESSVERKKLNIDEEQFSQNIGYYEDIE